MNVEIGKSDNDKCIVRVGPLTRSDPDAEIHIVKKTGKKENDWTRIERVFVQGKKKFSFDLEPGEYHVMVIGDKVAGVMNTAGHVLEHPWNVFLEAPAEHVKDYQRISVPVPPERRAKRTSVADAIKRTLH